VSNIFKIPKEFKAHRGCCAYDLPQSLYREADATQIEVFLRNGDIEIRNLYEVNWKATYLPTDVIAWRLCE